MMLDPRVTPARADLAAEELRGRVEAARFAAGELQTVTGATAPVRRGPSPDAPLDTEALHGEAVRVFDVSAGWAWGQLAADGYVGWMPVTALGAPGPSPTHRVTALRTLVFPGPSIKLPPRMGLPLGAAVAVERQDGFFAVLPDGGHIPARHLAQAQAVESVDFAGVAERFIGVPYLWGGKTTLGLDCSGLVQIAASACGIPCPRDSDMQEAALGAAVNPQDRSDFRRGDLVFWKGHVGVLRDAATLLHANAFHMAVTSEPLGQAIARIAAGGSAVTAMRRITVTSP